MSCVPTFKQEMVSNEIKHPGFKILYIYIKKKDDWEMEETEISRYK